MSRHYLLDGYNIIKQVPRLADLPLAHGRQQLLAWINVHRPQGSARNSVTVVFDGHPSCFGGQDGGQARVVFSSGRSADDVIKNAVDEARDKKNIVVVSNDKGITLYVRAQGARVMAVNEFAASFWGQGKASSAKGRAANTREGKLISYAQQKKINDEFTRLWLK